MRHKIRVAGAWHFDHFEHRRPALQVRVHPTNEKDVFVATVDITARWCGERDVLCSGDFVVRKRHGHIAVRERRPFIPM